MEPNLFETEFCKVEYIKKSNVVMIKWNKYCEMENYRTPAKFALKLMQIHKNSNLIIDARQGFEDNKADVEWAFKYLLPEMGRTTCTTVIFVMNKCNGIEAEMNMWEREFTKYFKVLRSETPEQGYAKLRNSI